MSFKEEYEKKVELIEEILKKYLPVQEGYQKIITEAMAYSLMAGGKRLRPMLMKESFDLFGGEGDLIDPFMAAIEMIHTYSLVHDDLPAMDNDDYRRGRKTTHVVYGEDMGILAGDALLNYAFETAFQAFSLAPEEASSIGRALQVLGEKAGIRGMIGGQVIDLESEGKSVQPQTLQSMYDLKTAALLRAACELGCIAAGASEEQLASARSYATALGFAFQIVDDILDIEGDSTLLGKETGSDAANGKRTYPAVYGMEKAKKDADAYTQSALEALKTFDNAEFLEMFTRKLAVRDR